MSFTSARVMNVNMKRLMELNYKKKSELNKYITEIEMHSVLSSLDQYVNELPAPDSSLQRSDMLNIYDIRSCFKGLRIYFDFVSQDAYQLCNAALAKKEKELVPEGGELQPRPLPSDTSINISILRPGKKPRLNLASSSKDLRRVEDVCAELRCINLIEEPETASNSLTPRKKEAMSDFGDSDAFQRDSLWLNSLTNGHPIQKEAMSDFGDGDAFRRDSLRLDSLTNGHPIQDTSPTAPLTQPQAHEEPMDEEQALFSRLEELGFSRIDRPPQTEIGTLIEKERPKAKSGKKAKPIREPKDIKNIFRRNTLLVGDLEDRQLSIRQQLMKLADVEDDWSEEEDIIDRMRFPMKKNFITFDVYTPRAPSDHIRQQPVDLEADLVKILEPSEGDQPMEVTQFPDDDLLMAAKSPRGTGSPPLIFDARPSYVGAVLEPGPVQVVETSRLDIAPRIGKSTEQRIRKSTLQRIEEAWRKHGDGISFSTIWPKTETSKLAAAIVFQELLDALVGEAKTVIATFMVDEQNYLPAWEALLKRYDNKRLLATSYIDQVLNFPLPKGPCDVLSLQSFLRVIAENVTAFKNIQIENEADFLLLTLALQKLDPETQQQFETKHVNNTWPSFKDLVDFVHGKCQVLQLTKQLNEQSPKGLRPSKTVTRSQVLTTTSNSSLPQISSNKGSLCNCRQQHHLFECPFFRNMFPTKRKLFLRNKKVCFNCLKPGHYVSDCSSTGRCRACKAKHHTLLHESSFGDLRKDPPQQSVPQEVKPSTSTSPSDSKQEGNTIIASVTGPAQVLLGTAEIFIPNSEGIPQPVRLLIDCGSQLSLITASCAKRLGLAWRAANHNLIAAGQTPMPGVKGRLCCHLQSRVYPDQKLEANPFVVQAITGELPTAPLNSQLADQLQPLLLADPLFWKPRQVDFLLGNDLFMKIIRSSPQPLSSDYGSIPTIFGLILMGNVAPSTSASGSSHCLCLTESPISAELINRFWEMEEVSSNSIAPQDDPCEQHFLKTHYRDASGRYVVSLPFKDPPSGLTESIELAYSRFQNLESQLKRKPFIKDKYINFMEEYHKLGHMAPTREPSAFVIPHHSVFKLSESKLRVVFDASMRTSSGSLNDKLHVGRKLQLDITDIILNFRRHVVAITADLIKMYRQILLNPSDRKYQHILWRSSPADPLITYELKTVTYGTASAPFTALRTIHQLVNDEGQSYPSAARVLLEDIYVDDIVSGAHTLEEALQLQIAREGTIRDTQVEQQQQGVHELGWFGRSFRSPVVGA